MDAGSLCSDLKSLGFSFFWITGQAMLRDVLTLATLQYVFFNNKTVQYFQGCVDEYEKCPQWSRAGHCTGNSDFMFFHCRESCGACGFKSRKFKVLKTISKKLKINTYRVVRQ